jgi:hypothetical protein
MSDNRTNRTIRATDKEWSDLKELAKSVGKKLTQFVLEETIYKEKLSAGSDDQNTLPEDSAHDIKTTKAGVRALLLLAQSDFIQRNKKSDFDKIIKGESVTSGVNIQDEFDLGSKEKKS